MPPLMTRRSASIPTLFSLSKLLHLVPAAIKQGPVKRDNEWVVTAAVHALNDGGEPDGPHPELMFKLLLSLGLVLLGGVFAGLTLALMGSDDLNLRVLAASSEDPKERRDASKVLRLLNRGRHWVLVVLLLANVIVNESLPIFLHEGGGFYAVAVSTVMIVIFGEVIPQAICVRYGLSIGGYCAPLVQFMMYLFAPVAWPLAKLLDWILGHGSGHTYKKAELKSFLQFHREGEEPLRDDEITILNGVLSLNDRHVKEIMTPIDDCLVLPADKILDHETVDHILISGFSRIPIHEPGQPDNFVGMLLVKRLITYNPEDELPVNKFTLNSLPEATPDLNCFQALDYFQTGRAHLLLISETPGRRGGGLGIISLEDLIEEIIGEEIIDETDRYQDNHSKRKAQRRATREIMLGIIERQRVINAFSRRPSGNNQASTLTASPAPREGILVQLSDVVHSEPDHFSSSYQAADHLGSPLKSDLKVVGDDSDHLTIKATSPNGQVSTIVEQPAAARGDAVLTGNPEESDKPAPAAKTVDTAKANETKDDASKGDEEDAVAEPETPTTESSTAPSDSKKKANGSKRRKVPRSASASVEQLLEPFPSPESLKAASRAFIAKYAGRRRVLGPERTNVGWKWVAVESKWRGEQGYMSRRSVISAPSTAAEGDFSHELEDEEDDEATAPLTTKERIELDASVVYSPTYRVPVLCFSAWDAQGVPLPLAKLARYVLRGIPHGDGDGDGDAPGRPDALMLPGGAFPLLQQTEHPITGHMVWSVHPCEVRGAVAEIVRGELAAGREGERGAAGQDEDEDEDEDEGECDAARDGQDETEADDAGMRMRWLEAWFMLSDSVVDLTL